MCNSHQCSKTLSKYKYAWLKVCCLFQRKRGFTNLTGVDYSDLAVMLAKSVSKSDGFEDITFEVCIEKLNGCLCKLPYTALILGWQNLANF